MKLKQHDKMPEQFDPRGNFICTLSGARFYIVEANVQDIPITDIARSLSMKCRFNGHLSRFYSVAEHSVWVSMLCDPKDALWGLLHDISEAFLPDVPRPVKPFLSGFRELETNIRLNAMPHFGLDVNEPESVALVDKHIVANEALQLFPTRPDWIDAYDLTVAPVKDLTSSIGMASYQAEYHFLRRFKQLTGQ
jgi:uncharacterized protein